MYEVVKSLAKSKEQRAKSKEQRAKSKETSFCDGIIGYISLTGY